MSNFKHSILFILLLFIFNDVTAQLEPTFIQIEGYAGNEKISDLVVSKDNTVHVASTSGVSYISEGNEQCTKGNISEEVIAIKVSKNGDVYTGLANNQVYANDQLIFSCQDNKVRFTDIEIYKNDLYVASTEGIFIIDLFSKKMKGSYTEGNSLLKSNKINFVYADSRNWLWIGTDKGIVYQRDKDGAFYRTYDPQYKYIAATENEDGVWLLSNEKLYNIESSTYRWIDAGLNKGLYKGELNDIAFDQQGHLYVASDVLVKFDPAKDEIEEYSDVLGIVSKKCLTLECDDNNDIWLGTLDAGLFKITMQDKKETKTMDLLVTTILETALTCNGSNNAKLLVSVQGGEQPYIYTWGDASITGSNPGNLSEGAYALTVTDANGLSKETEVQVDAPNEIGFKIVSKSRVSGPSKKDGQCEIKIAGGTTPYEVLWDNKEKGTIAKKLGHGLHSFTITDAKGCTLNDEIEIKKEKLIPNLDVAKVQVGQILRINKLSFAADSSYISETSYEALDEVYDFLNENPTIYIEIAGHTNGVPPHEYCDNLSTSRANNVAKYLLTKGIEATRVKAKGYGKRKPIASNDTNSGRKKNQRVEIKILEIKG